MHRERATEADKDFFRRLNELSYRDVVIRQFGAWDDALQSSNFETKWREQAFEKILVGDTMIGGIWTEQRPDHIRIREIQIHPDHRGRGLGTIVLREEMESATRRGVPLRLRVLIENRAKQLYARLGFVETGRDETHFYMEYSPQGSTG